MFIPHRQRKVLLLERTTGEVYVELAVHCNDCTGYIIKLCERSEAF